MSESSSTASSSSTSSINANVTDSDNTSATSADVPSTSSNQDLQLAAQQVPEEVDQEKKAQAQEHKLKGNEHFSAQRFDAAKHEYTLAIDLDPTIAAFYTNRAASENMLEQYNLAIEDANQAIKLDPSYVKAYFRRATAYFKSNNLEAALQDFEHVLVHEPSNAFVQKQIEQVSSRIRKESFFSAIQVREPHYGSPDYESYFTDPDMSSRYTSVSQDYNGPRLADGDDPETAHLGKIDQAFIDGMIQYFKDGKRLPRRYAWQIILGAIRALKQEPTVVDYHIAQGTTIDVIGDTHGQFFDFVHLLGLTGPPSDTHAVLFNGDFVDRGSWSVEIALTVFAYKWLYPKTTLINRGNHETKEMNHIYGFEDEVEAKFDSTTYQLFTDAFVALPLATLITASRPPLTGDQLPASFSIAQREPIVEPETGFKRFFVVHGGLFSRDDVTLDRIRALNRFQQRQPGEDGLMMELLWSDPQTEPGRAPSKRGVATGFGPDVTKAWCELNHITAVLRSHEVRMGGYEEEHDGLCCTIFSAPNYCDSTGNLGAFARIDDQGTIHYTKFEAQPHPDMKPMAYGSRVNSIYRNYGF